VNPASTSLVTSRAFHSMAAVGERAYVFGGDIQYLLTEYVEYIGILEIFKF
jgi:hypothetical protein